jgi:hypothetical protein
MTLTGRTRIPAASLLDSWTTIPPSGAALLSVAVPWTVPPLPTVVGLSRSEVTAAAGGLIVRVAVAAFATPASEAVIVALTLDATLLA